MLELTSEDVASVSGGDAYYDIGHGVGTVVGTVVDGVGDAYQGAVNLTTDFLCWATGNC